MKKEARKQATISIQKVYGMLAKDGINTMTVIDAKKPGGREIVSTADVKLGDVIVIDNHGKKVVKCSGAKANLTKVSSFVTCAEQERKMKKITEESNRIAEQREQEQEQKEQEQEQEQKEQEQEQEQKEQEQEQKTVEELEAEAKKAEAEAMLKNGENKGYFNINFTIHCDFVKPGKMDDVVALVKYDVFQQMLSNAKKAYETTKNQIEKHHALKAVDLSDEDYYTYALQCEKTVNKAKVHYDDRDAVHAVQARQKYFDMYKELQSYSDVAEVYATLTSGQLHKVRLLSIRNYTGFTFNADLLKTDKTDDKGRAVLIDYKTAIKKCFSVKDCNKGYKKICNDVIRPLIDKVFGSDDDLFFGIEATTAQLISAKNIIRLRMFVSRFAKGAFLHEDGSFDYDYQFGASYFTKELFNFVSVLIDHNTINIKKKEQEQEN